MKNKELEKYQNKQLNSETPYGLKPYQVLITAIIVLLVGLFIVIPMVISKEYGFNFDYATTVLAVFIFIIFVLFPPIFLIFLGNFIQRLIHRIAKTKYHIYMFPLFVILFCTATFIATVYIVMNDYNNHVYDPEAPKMFAIATGFL